jgi:hypothetical protein
LKGSFATEDDERRLLQLKYDITAWFYDILGSRVVFYLIIFRF